MVGFTAPTPMTITHANDNTTLALLSIVQCVRCHIQIARHCFLPMLQLLYDTFNAFGVIVQTPKIMRDPETGLSRGFGFVSYDSFDASDAAIEAMNGQFLCNRWVLHLPGALHWCRGLTGAFIGLQHCITLSTTSCSLTLTLCIAGRSQWGMPSKRTQRASATAHQQSGCCRRR